MNKDTSKLVTVHPGSYMLLSKNEMKRITCKTQGLALGPRVKNDNHSVVLVEDTLILVPTARS